MSGFSCKNCKSDLSTRVDLLALSVQAEYPEGEYPDDLCVEGNCGECGKKFTFEGPMFASFIRAKIEEGVISTEAQEYDLFEVSLTEEQFEEFNRLVEAGDREAIRDFIRSIIDP